MSVATPNRKRSVFIDYAAFALLFASVSVAVAIALGGIVLLLTPDSDAPADAATTAQLTNPTTPSNGTNR